MVLGLAASGPVLARPLGYAWIDYASNPVYDPPVVGDRAYYPAVLYDSDSFSGHGPAGQYRMWYADGAGQYEAMTTSSDGKTWAAPTPTAGIHADGYHAKVLYLPAGYGAGPYYFKIWYWNAEAYITPTAMRTADSVDGFNFVNDQDLGQDPAARLWTGVWPDWNYGTYGPITIMYNSSATNTGANPFDYTFAMYYDGTTGSKESIGLGYSADGNYWTRYGSTPVFNYGAEGAWDGPSGGVGGYATHGTVFKKAEGNWELWYSGGQSTCEYGIGYATSADGLTWTRDPDNPMFSIADGKAWRSSRTYTPTVVYSATNFDGNGDACNYKMWYSGRSGSGHYTVGYAYSTTPQLSLTKTANPPGQVHRGDAITYTLQAGNSGGATAYSCALSDSIPANTTYVPGSTTLNGVALPDVGGVSPLLGGMAVNSPGAGSGTIVPTGTAEVTFQVTVNIGLPVGAPVSNSATLTAEGQSPVVAGCSNTSYSPAIAVSMTPDPVGSITRGSVITYTITPGNTGADVAVGCQALDTDIYDIRPGLHDSERLARWRRGGRLPAHRRHAGKLRRPADRQDISRDERDSDIPGDCRLRPSGRWHRRRGVLVRGDRVGCGQRLLQ